MNHRSFLFVLNYHQFLNAVLMSVLYIHISSHHSVTDPIFAILFSIFWREFICFPCMSHANDHVQSFTTKFLLAFLPCSLSECYNVTYPVGYSPVRMLCSSLSFCCTCFTAFSTYPAVVMSLSSEGYWFALLV
jgi:hypothetical protein